MKRSRMKESKEGEDEEGEDEEGKDEEGKDEGKGKGGKTEDEEKDDTRDQLGDRIPEVTISAFAETGLRGIINCCSIATLANTLCAFLGVQSLLDQLNTTSATSYSLDNPFLSFVLEDCIEDSWDFGLAYSYLRQIWYTNDWNAMIDVNWRWREEDQEKRQEVLNGDQIVYPWLPPQHVWDLYSNWVVLYWMMDAHVGWPWPISHAWVDKKDRTTVWMPINGYKWPVPIPKDADFNLIHIEMLNLGLECMWLDVLCLRQEGRWREDLHVEEWRLDAPTIRHVYFVADVVCYLSGLGQPLTLNEGDLESDQSWFRHAWMLQEIGMERVIARGTPEWTNACRVQGWRKLRDMQNSDWLHDVLAEMQTRVSTNLVDKIAGLAFLTGSQQILAYSESTSLEHAWTALVDLMHGHAQAELFISCAEPGDGGPK
ncbi:hypothetical protein IW261DRAFT_1659633 [Armillaria novae-zelandiae]|uniref:Heterokaryon incompatibility domain-containing protein n=1 Tax=Armillaria novae-zelandiae TaxID=153914 RepID=A0AA39U2L5_9AGAR|nr:hypothetical protein IW261DRAFT_1659633 [Armillaria novae-zelandiae]